MTDRDDLKVDLSIIQDFNSAKNSQQIYALNINEFSPIAEESQRSQNESVSNSSKSPVEGP